MHEIGMVLNTKTVYQTLDQELTDLIKMIIGIH